MPNETQKLKGIVSEIISDGCKVLELELKPITENPEELHSGESAKLIETNVGFALKICCENQSGITVLKRASTYSENELTNHLIANFTQYEGKVAKNGRIVNSHPLIGEENSLPYGKTTPIWCDYNVELQKDKRTTIVLPIGSPIQLHYTLTVHFDPNFIDKAKLVRLLTH